MVFRDLSKTICYNPRLPFGFKEWMIFFLFFFVKRTVKLANKERFDKELIGIKEPFTVTNLPFTS